MGCGKDTLVIWVLGSGIQFYIFYSVWRGQNRGNLVSKCLVLGDGDLVPGLEDKIMDLSVCFSCNPTYGGGISYFEDVCPPGFKLRGCFSNVALGWILVFSSKTCGILYYREAGEPSFSTFVFNMDGNSFNRRVYS